MLRLTLVSEPSAAAHSDSMFELKRTAHCTLRFWLTAFFAACVAEAH